MRIVRLMAGTSVVLAAGGAVGIHRGQRHWLRRRRRIMPNAATHAVCERRLRPVVAASFADVADATLKQAEITSVGRDLLRPLLLVRLEQQAPLP